MGQIHNHLCQLLEPDPAHLIQGQGHYQRCGKTQYKNASADHEGIHQHPPEIRIRQHRPVIVQPHEGAVADDPEFLEADKEPPHQGVVGKRQEVGNHGDYHHIENTVPRPQSAQQRKASGSTPSASPADSGGLFLRASGMRDCQLVICSHVSFTALSCVKP
ncbi:hypothetical protein D3C81_1765340 [compost metagenome]